MLEPLGDFRGHKVLAVYQRIWNYFSILLPITMTLPIDIGLILAVRISIFSLNRKSYIKMARWSASV